MSRHVEQRAAGIAGIDGRVCLDHVNGKAGGVHIPLLGTHITHSEGGCQLTQRIADGNHLISHSEGIAVTQFHRRQALRLHLQQSHIIGIVRTHKRCLVFLIVSSDYGQFRAALNHMVVGDHIAIFGENETGAGGCAGIKAAGGYTLDQNHAGAVCGINFRRRSRCHQRLAGSNHSTGLLLLSQTILQLLQLGLIPGIHLHLLGVHIPSHQKSGGNTAASYQHRRQHQGQQHLGEIALFLMFCFGSDWLRMFKLFKIFHSLQPPFGLYTFMLSASYEKNMYTSKTNFEFSPSSYSNRAIPSRFGRNLVVAMKADFW